MKAHGGRKCIAAFILNLVDRGPRRFSPGKEPRYRLNRRLGGPKNCSRGFRRRKKMFCLLHTKPKPSSYVRQEL